MYFNTFFFNQLLISFDFCYRIIKVLPAVLVFSLLNQYPVARVPALLPQCHIPPVI